MRYCGCGRGNLVPDGKDECFRCSVLGVGFTFRGGALTSGDGFHMTKQDFLREHLGAETEKQLLKNPNVEKV